MYNYLEKQKNEGERYQACLNHRSPFIFEVWRLAKQREPSHRQMRIAATRQGRAAFLNLQFHMLFYV